MYNNFNIVPIRTTSELSLAVKVNLLNNYSLYVHRYQLK